MRFDPLPEPEIAAILLEQGIARDADDAAGWRALGEGSVSRAVGLADAELERFRRVADRRVGRRARFRSALHWPIDCTRIIKQAGKESVDQRRRASLLIGELARVLPRRPLADRRPGPPLPRPADRQAVHALARRLEPEDVLVLADRCIEADYHVQRRLYMPLILESLMHDLGKVINAAVGVAVRGRHVLRLRRRHRRRRFSLESSVISRRRGRLRAKRSRNLAV